MSKNTHRGLRAHRLASNPEEKRFAKAWTKANEQGDVLAHMLDDRAVQGGEVPEASERDRTVAATVIQWLGSAVGQAFLDDLGYRRGS